MISMMLEQIIHQSTQMHPEVLVEKIYSTSWKYIPTAVATAFVIACSLSTIRTVDSSMQLTEIEAKHTACRQHRC